MTSPETYLGDSVVTEGEEVFVKGEDGLMYFGIVVEVDDFEEQCLVRFGDCTEKWSPLLSVQRLSQGQNGAEPEEPEEEEFYQDQEFDSGYTNGGYYDDTPPYLEAQVQIPPTPTAILEEDDEDNAPLKSLKKKLKKKKKRQQRLFASPKLPPPSGSASRASSSRTREKAPPRVPPVPVAPSEHVIEARKALPYDFDALQWDENHQRNEEERYCYCGEQGDWYKKMFQCNKCLQWFHQKCLRITTPPLLFGDRFFDFACVLCTGTSEESIKRLDMSWVESLHLILFNLTVTNSKKYHDLESSVIPFFKRKLKGMQGDNSCLKQSKVELGHLSSLLTSNKTRFKCGSESKKRSTYWGLRKVAPPVVPNKYGLNGSTVNLNEGVYFTASNGGTINYKSKLETKQKRLKRQNSQTAVEEASQSKKSRPDTKNVAKKRGRPPGSAKKTAPNQQFNLQSQVSSSLESTQYESDGGETTASSRGTLDSFIPPPKDFEGFNNPFRNLGIGEPLVLNTLNLPNAQKSSRKGKRTDSLLMVHDPSKPILPLGDVEAQSEDGQLMADLKCSLNSYFGAETRMTKGERFNVGARRLNGEGLVQYLIEWEQPNPLSPPCEPPVLEKVSQKSCLDRDPKGPPPSIGSLLKKPASEAFSQREMAEKKLSKKHDIKDSVVLISKLDENDSVMPKLEMQVERKRKDASPPVLKKSSPEKSLERPQKSKSMERAKTPEEKSSGKSGPSDQVPSERSKPSEKKQEIKSKSPEKPAVKTQNDMLREFTKACEVSLPKLNDFVVKSDSKKSLGVHKSGSSSQNVDKSKHSEGKENAKQESTQKGTRIDEKQNGKLEEKQKSVDRLNSEKTSKDSESVKTSKPVSKQDVVPKEPTKTKESSELSMSQLLSECTKAVSIEKKEVQSNGIKNEVTQTKTLPSKNQEQKLPQNSIANGGAAKQDKKFDESQTKACVLQTVKEMVEVIASKEEADAEESCVNGVSGKPSQTVNDCKSSSKVDSKSSTTGDSKPSTKVDCKSSAKVTSSQLPTTSLLKVQERRLIVPSLIKNDKKDVPMTNGSSGSNSK